jgi:ribosomal protein S16
VFFDELGAGQGLGYDPVDNDRQEILMLAENFQEQWAAAGVLYSNRVTLMIH